MNPFGPMFWHELTRLARRGSHWRFRAVFAMLLLAALFTTYLSIVPGAKPLRVFTLEQQLPIEQTSRFGERFLIGFLLVQLLVVVILTPVLTAGAIIEEKERRSLDFLLSSPLSSREIVLGKLAARLVFVAVLMLTGLPVLAMTMFFGGVDVATLLAGYAITLLTVVSLGSFSLVLAVTRDSLSAVLFRVYLVVVGLTVFGTVCGCLAVPVFSSPFSTLYVLFAGWPGFTMIDNMMSKPLWLTVAYGILHLAMAGVCLGRAIEMVRTPLLGKYAEPPSWAPPRYAFPRDDDLAPLADSLPVVETFSELRTAPRTRRVPSLTDDEDPLHWKERWFGVRSDGQSRKTTTLVLVVLSIPLLIALEILISATMLTLVEGDDLGSIYGPVARLVITFVLCALMVFVGTRVAGCVVKERHQSTLDSLLMLPVERRGILRAKALAALRVARIPIAIALGFVVVGIVLGGVVGPGWVVVQLLFLGWIGLAVGFGMWLSVSCATPTRATTILLFTFTAIAIIPPLLAGLVRNSSNDMKPQTSQWLQAILQGCGPVNAAWNAATAPENSTLLPTAGAAIGAIFAGVCGWGFWCAAERRFDREGR